MRKISQEILSVTIATKMIIPGMSLSKDVNNLYIENYKTL
jgi:hypothetical protein